MNTIGERIKEIRKDEHLTQVEFAQIFGLSHSHISNIENNRENPSETLLLFICSKFNVCYDWLVDGTGTRKVMNGYSRRGRINNYNLASKEFENNYKLMNDDEIIEYTNAAFSALQVISSNFNTNKLNRYEILKAQNNYFNTMFLINNSVNKLDNLKKIDSNEKLNFILKFNKMLLKSNEELKELVVQILLDKEIEF